MMYDEKKKKRGSFNKETSNLLLQIELYVKYTMKKSYVKGKIGYIG